MFLVSFLTIDARCDHVPLFHKLVTITINCVKEPPATLDKILKNVNRLYPGVKLIAGVKKDKSYSSMRYQDVDLIYFDPL